MNRLQILPALVLAFASTLSIAAPGDAKPASSATAPAPYTGNLKKLGKAELDAVLARPGKILFVDVRRPDELTKIGGFPVYLSVQSDEIEKYLDFIPKDRDIITVSNHAARALRVGDVLVAKGYKVIGAAGVQNYEEEGGKITRIAVPAPKTAAAAAAAAQ